MKVVKEGGTPIFDKKRKGWILPPTSPKMLAPPGCFFFLNILRASSGNPNAILVHPEGYH